MVCFPKKFLSFSLTTSVLAFNASLTFSTETMTQELLLEGKADSSAPRYHVIHDSNQVAQEGIEPAKVSEQLSQFVPVSKRIENLIVNIESLTKLSDTTQQELMTLSADLKNTSEEIEKLQGIIDQPLPKNAKGKARATDQIEDASAKKAKLENKLAILRRGIQVHTERQGITSVALYQSKLNLERLRVFDTLGSHKSHEEPTPQFVPIPKRIENLTTVIESLTKLLDQCQQELVILSDEIKSTSEKIATFQQILDKPLPKNKKGKAKAKVRKKEASEEKPKLEAKLATLRNDVQLLTERQTFTSAALTESKDVLASLRVSNTMGSFSFANKSPDESYTWRHIIGAPVEFMGQFGATLLRPFYEDGSKIPSMVHEQVAQMQKDGAATYAYHTGKKTIFGIAEAVARDPLASISIPAAFALTYGNFSDFTTLAIATGANTAGSLTSSQFFWRLAKSIESDHTLTNLLKVGLYGGAAYYFITSIPGAEAAVFTWTPFLISADNPVTSALSTCGTAVCSTWNNGTYIKQQCYDSSTHTSLGGPNILNQNAFTGMGIRPTSCVSPSTKTMMNVWINSGKNVAGRLSTPTGASGSETVLSSSTGTHTSAGVVGLPASGTFMGYWTLVGTSNSNVNYDMFNATTLASKLGESTLSGTVTTDQVYADCAAIGSTTTQVGCVWMNYGPGTPGISAISDRILNTDGSFKTAIQTFSSVASVDQTSPSIVAMSDGNGQVTFGNGTVVSAGTLNPSTGAASNLAQVSASAKVNTLPFPSVGSITDGSALYVYQGVVGAGNPQIYAVDASEAGSIYQAESALPSSTNTQVGPSVIGLPSTGALASWKGDDGSAGGLAGAWGSGTPSTTAPSSTTTAPSSTTTAPSSTTTAPSTTTSPSATTTSPSATTTSPSATTTSPSGTTTSPSGTTTSPSGTTPSANTTAPTSAAGQLAPSFVTTLIVGGAALLQDWIPNPFAWWGNKDK